MNGVSFKDEGWSLACGSLFHRHDGIALEVTQLFSAETLL